MFRTLEDRQCALAGPLCQHGQGHPAILSQHIKFTTVKLVRSGQPGNFLELFQTLPREFSILTADSFAR